jgi:hypothetical protein
MKHVKNWDAFNESREHLADGDSIEILRLIMDKGYIGIICDTNENNSDAVYINKLLKDNINTGEKIVLIETSNLSDVSNALRSRCDILQCSFDDISEALRSRCLCFQL